MARQQKPSPQQAGPCGACGMPLHGAVAYCPFCGAVGNAGLAAGAPQVRPAQPRPAVVPVGARPETVAQAPPLPPQPQPATSVSAGPAAPTSVAENSQQAVAGPAPPLQRQSQSARSLRSIKAWWVVAALACIALAVMTLQRGNAPADDCSARLRDIDDLVAANKPGRAQSAFDNRPDACKTTSKGAATRQLLGARRKQVADLIAQATKYHDDHHASAALETLDQAAKLDVENREIDQLKRSWREQPQPPKPGPSAPPPSATRLPASVVGRSGAAQGAAGPPGSSAASRPSKVVKPPPVKVVPAEPVSAPAKPDKPDKKPAVKPPDETDELKSRCRDCSKKGATDSCWLLCSPAEREPNR